MLEPTSWRTPSGIPDDGDTVATSCDRELSARAEARGVDGCTMLQKQHARSTCDPPDAGRTVVASRDNRPAVRTERPRVYGSLMWKAQHLRPWAPEARSTIRARA